MRKAMIPQADRGNVYRLIFFAWSEGGIDYQDSSKMRHLANEMGIQWRVFSRNIEQYSALCEGRSLPSFLLANHREMAAKIPENAKVSPENSSQIPKFDDQNADKNRQIAPKSNESSRANTSESEIRVRNQSQKSEGGTGAKIHAREFAPLPATPEAAERRRAIDKTTDFLIERYRLPIIKFAEQYEIASLTVCQTVKAGCEIAALEDFFRERNGKKTELRFLPEDFAAWAAWKKGEANGNS